MLENLFIGVDIGTSGVRAVCMDGAFKQKSLVEFDFNTSQDTRRNPKVWAEAVQSVLLKLLIDYGKENIKAVCVDGTSGTVLLTDDKGNPVSQAMMYNDVCRDANILEGIQSHAPATSAAHGPTSGLAKALQLRQSSPEGFVQHEADWVTACLTGKFALSDENNALKTGYDPVSQTWPDWIKATGIEPDYLPVVQSAGTPIGHAEGWLAGKVGLSPETLVVAGTTDGCASFLATGASKPGDAVTVLGSTMTIKVLSPKPIFAPQYGIYSHRIYDTWLAGGASNTGGKVLDKYFSSQELVDLSATMDVQAMTGLDYYPLLSPGERFPISDSDWLPRLDPRPSSDQTFLKGMLEGMSAIEKLAYDRLAELGGLYPKTLRTMGGGAENAAWTKIREKTLGLENLEVLSKQAATGAALLARSGAITAGTVAE